MKLFVLISGVAVVLSSSVRCLAKDCESCSFQTGCLWQSVSMTCVETAACTPVGACVDRPSFCYPRALLAKALQEGRVETQIFNAMTPSQDKTSYTCQLDECAQSQDPKNICKVMGGVNYEVRKTTDPKSETATITKYMYVCICGPDWEAGPNHRNCRKRGPDDRFGSDSMSDGSGGMNFFSRGPDGSSGGYNFLYGSGPSYGSVQPSYGPASSYGPAPSYGPGPSYGPTLPYGTYPVPVDPYQETDYQDQPNPQSFHPPFARLVPSTSSKFPRLIQFEYGAVPNTNASGNATNGTERPPFGYGIQNIPVPEDPPISDGILVSGGMDDAETADYSNVDDEYGPYKRGEIIIPSEEYPRNRTTLASLIPSVDVDDDDHDDDKERGRKFPLPPKLPFPKKKPDKRWKRNETRMEPDDIPLAPTTRPPTPSSVVPQVNVPVMVPLNSLELAGARLQFLEYLVYSVIAFCGVAAIGVVVYYILQRRSAKKAQQRMLTPIPFVMNELDPEYSKNSEGGSMYPLDVVCDDWDTVSKRACEDAWAKLGGLPGKGMSQVVIYYGTPYASVVRSQDSTQSITEDCRDNVVVDVTLTPEEPQSESSSSCQTRAKFRYVLRRDTSHSSRSGSMSTNMSLVSNTACSTSDSAAEY